MAVLAAAVTHGAALVTCALGQPAAVEPVLNEILYDPIGPDAGAEFVELYNPGAEPVSLDGVRLEFANGADDEPDWRLQWAGGPGDALPPGGFFLVADVGWTGVTPDAVTNLSLQNGPDALRVVRGGAVLDLVGYGPLANPSFYEGRPAVGAASGLALARRPDGRDTGDNAADLVAAAPTPGERNFPRHALALVSWDCEPPSLAHPGRPVAMTAEVVNTGLETLPAASGRLLWGEAMFPAVLPAAAPGETVTVVATVAPDAGRCSVGLEWPAPEAAAGAVILPLGHFLAGAPAVRIEEVMAAPRSGGEWVELLCQAETRVDAARLSVRDDDGAWLGLPGAPHLDEGGRLLLAEDPAAMTAYWWSLPVDAGAGCDGGDRTPVVRPTGWPALNNTAPAHRARADRFLLADSLGVIDHVTIGPGAEPGRGAAPAGRSLERRYAPPGAPETAAWAPCTAPAGGTPGCPGSVAPPEDDPGGSLTAAPNPLLRTSGEGGVLHLRFVLAPAESAFDLRVFDLWGGCVRDLGGDLLGSGPRHVIWDGRDDGGRVLPPGGYVVLLRRRDAAGQVSGAEKVLVALAGGTDR
ncbi:MAG: lamin tail domain-containing protein [Candidatus Krumholzibacteriia bacterium]